MLIACIGYVSYDVLPSIHLHSVIRDIGEGGHPSPPLVHYNEDLLYTYWVLMDEVLLYFI
jgi:hypothetical protein